MCQHLGTGAQAAGTGRAEEADTVPKSILHLQSCSLGYGQLNYSHTEVRSSKQLVYGGGNISLAGTVLTLVV